PSSPYTAASSWRRTTGSGSVIGIRQDGRASSSLGSPQHTAHLPVGPRGLASGTPVVAAARRPCEVAIGGRGSRWLRDSHTRVAAAPAKRGGRVLGYGR